MKQWKQTSVMIGLLLIEAIIMLYAVPKANEDEINMQMWLVIGLFFFLLISLAILIKENRGKRKSIAQLFLIVSIRLRTTCIFDSKLEATCSSWPKLGQVDSSWSVLPTCLAGVHGELHGCSRSRVSGAGHPPSIHVD